MTTSTAPFIDIQEIDSSQQSKKVDLSSVAAGFGYFKKGAAFKPVLVTTPDTFVEEFGSAYAENMIDQRNMINFFKESGGSQVYVTRLIHDQLPIAGAVGTGYAYSAGSQNAGLGILATGGKYTGDTSLLFLNDDDYESKRVAGISLDSTEIVRFYAKNAGDWGNLLQVAVCDETNRQLTTSYYVGSSTFKSIFKFPIDSTTNKEICLVVLDSSANILEKWVVSLVKGTKNQYGQNSYVEDFLLANSKYIRAFHSTTNTNVPDIMSAEYLADGEDVATGHYVDLTNGTFRIDNSAMTILNDTTINGLNIMKDVESYPIDVMVDSAYVAEGNMILKVSTDATHTADLLISSDMMKTNLYVAQVADPTGMTLGGVIVINTSGNAFKGYGKLLARYGYTSGATTHYVIFETDQTVIVTDKLVNTGITVAVADIASLNSSRKSHTLVESTLVGIAYERGDCFIPTANSVSPAMLSGVMTEADFILKAIAYFNTGTPIATPTAKAAACYSAYYNAMYDYVPELDLNIIMPCGGAIAGKYVANDKKFGEWFAPAGSRGDVTITKLWHSPNEATRVALNNVHINTLYTKNGIVKLDGNETAYSINSLYSDIDVKRLVLLIKKYSNYELLRIQFQHDTSTKRDKFIKRMKVRLDNIVNKEGLTEYGIADKTSTDDEKNDTSRFVIIAKPTTTTKEVIIDISLDAIDANYTES